MSTDQVDMVDALVIFGATGDLAKMDTFPALVGLVERGVLDVPVIGVAKSGWGLDQFRDYATASLQLNKMDPASPAAAKMLGLLRYVDGDLDDPATYAAMSDAMGQAQQALFYLEVPPPLFGRIAEGISKAGRATGSRVMVEKPFGTDLASAQQLNATMQAYFPEDAIYRVDHWLGLDPVDSLMFVRFANSVIEPLLNRNYVQSIQITMAEAFDVADRGSFYDKTGAIRDVVQNHLLQVLATVLAEPPDGTGLDSWRAAKSQLIGALRPLTPEVTVKGQYDGYLQVAGVDPKSVTETYVAIRLAADSWRWADVPILIRAGKCLPVTATEVTITFRRPPHDAFESRRPGARQPPAVPDQPREPGQPVPGRQEARRRLAARAGGTQLRRAPGHGHAPVRPAHRRRARRGTLAVRLPGHGRGGLAGRRPRPRQRSPGASLREGQLGPGPGRRPAARRRGWHDPRG